jgi:ribulose-5-phosphate 4-epimerase/fuculose-1-phosphate aldolase
MSVTSSLARLKGSSSLRERVSSAEWETRVELAAAHRYAEDSQWTDLILNHFTARVPGEPNHFLVKQHELLFEEVTASNLLKITMEGKPVGTDQHVNAAAYTIHTAIFEARPDVSAILHIHGTPGMVLAAHAHGLRYLCQDAMMFYNRVGYHDFEGIALDLDERERLARNLGPHDTLILRNHGLLTCGRSIAEAVVRMHTLVEVAEVQARMEATGQEMCVPPPDVCEKTARQIDNSMQSGFCDAMWQAVIRSLDRRDSSFRE